MSKSEIARQLGISSQLYGQYEPDSGKGKIPGLMFAIKWKQVFGDNLIDHLETNVSRETKTKKGVNSTPPDLDPAKAPALLYAELKELVKAAREIATNTGRLHDSKLDIDRMKEIVLKDSAPSKGTKNKE